MTPTESLAALASHRPIVVRRPVVVVASRDWERLGGGAR